MSSGLPLKKKISVFLRFSLCGPRPLSDLCVRPSALLGLPAPAVRSDDPDQFKFMEHLTQYAWDQMVKQYMRAKELSERIVENEDDPGNFEVGSKCYTFIWHADRNFFSQVHGQSGVRSTSCHCSFFKKNGLPCRHILAVRSHCNLSVFHEQLCLERWTRKHFLAHQPAFASATEIEHSPSNIAVEMTALHPASSSSLGLTPNAKFQAAKKACLRLASSLSCLPDAMFDEQLKQVNTMEGFLKQLQTCAVIEILDTGMQK